MALLKKGLCFAFLALALWGCSEDTVDFTLTINTIGNGSVSQEKLDDKTIRLTAQPEVNSRFINWSGDATGTQNPVEIILDANKSVTANFDVEDLLEIRVSEGGSYEKEIVSSDNGVLVYEARAIPASGYEFVSWTHSENEYFTQTLRLEVENETVISLDFADTNAPFTYDKAAIVNLSNETIWGLDALSNDHLIFTTKSGKIYAYKEGQSALIWSHYEDVVNPSGQGGLLDIKLDPNYEQNKYVYVTYSEKVSGSNFSYLSLDRFRYENGQVSGIENIFKTGTPSKRAGHFGSRISFSEEFLFLSIGEGSPSQGGENSVYKNAQDLSNDWGKIHRLNLDGSVPVDNPFYNNNEARNTIYSYGHRNPQGLMFDPYSSSIISSEHGPKGGDEINVIEAGLNYGWPLVSYGINYDGSDISGRSHQGYEEPVYYWDPSIATSHIIGLKDKNHKSWFKNILVAGLKSKAIFRLKSENGVYQQVEKITLGYRVRSLCEGEDGVFFVSNDNGQIVKFSPAE